MTDSTTKKVAKENAEKYVKVPRSLKNAIAAEAKRLQEAEDRVVTEGDVVRRAWDALVAHYAKQNAQGIPSVIQMLRTSSTFSALPHGASSDTVLEYSPGAVRSWFEVLRQALDGPDSTARQLLLVSLQATRELLGEPEAIGDAPPGSHEETEAEAKARTEAAAERDRDLIRESQRDVTGDPESREGVG